MCKKILLLGGGGHCKSVLDTLLEQEEYCEIGIIDVQSKTNDNIFGIKYIGCDEDLDDLFQQGYTYAFITIGSIGDTSIRKKMVKKIESIGFTVPNIVSKTAVIGREVRLGKGIYVGKSATINCSTTIEDFSIINTCTLIEHDCIVGEFAHIASGSVLCGDVKIGKNTHVGANSTVRQGLNVGNDVTIGIGSVVVSDIKDNSLAYGNPCREVK